VQLARKCVFAKGLAKLLEIPWRVRYPASNQNSDQAFWSPHPSPNGNHRILTGERLSRVRPSATIFVLNTSK
jgi:hypothetical protein